MFILVYDISDIYKPSMHFHSCWAQASHVYFLFISNVITIICSVGGWQLCVISDNIVIMFSGR